jgi:hypothetical protein
MHSTHILVHTLTHICMYTNNTGSTGSDGGALSRNAYIYVYTQHIINRWWYPYTLIFTHVHMYTQIKLLCTHSHTFACIQTTQGRQAVMGARWAETLYTKWLASSRGGNNKHYAFVCVFVCIMKRCTRNGWQVRGEAINGTPSNTRTKIVPLCVYLYVPWNNGWQMWGKAVIIALL